MKYEIQAYPYEDWITVATFDSKDLAQAELDRLRAVHDALPQQWINYKLKEVK